MATTTFKAILDRFQAICEGGTLALTPSLVPFTHKRAPNSVADSQYFLEDVGLSKTTIGTSDVEFRIDQVTVWLARRTAFAGQTAAETLHTTLNTLERLILADGPANSYHASVTGRQAPTPINEGGEIIVAGLTFAVDYDFSTAVT